MKKGPEVGRENRGTFPQIDSTLTVQYLWRIQENIKEMTHLVAWGVRQQHVG